MARNANLSGTYTASGAGQSKTIELHPGNADTLVGLLWSDAAGNLLIEQSIDGTNWDLDDTIAVVVGTGVKVSVDVVAPFARATFTNTSAGTSNVRCALRYASAGYRG